MNKGNSNFHTYGSIMRHNVIDNLADVAIIGEANLTKGDDKIITDYPEYNVEAKFMDGFDEARIVVLIKKGIRYQRITRLEHEDMSCIWLKVNISRGKNLNIVCIYRQWKLPPILRTSSDRIVDMYICRLGLGLAYYSKTKKIYICSYDSGRDTSTENQNITF